jgi:hypothetical protein
VLVAASAGLLACVLALPRFNRSVQALFRNCAVVQMSVVLLVQVAMVASGVTPPLRYAGYALFALPFGVIAMALAGCSNAGGLTADPI